MRLQHAVGHANDLESGLGIVINDQKRVKVDRQLLLGASCKDKVYDLYHLRVRYETVERYDKILKQGKLALDHIELTAVFQNRVNGFDYCKFLLIRSTARNQSCINEGRKLCHIDLACKCGFAYCADNSYCLSIADQSIFVESSVNLDNKLDFGICRKRTGLLHEGIKLGNQSHLLSIGTVRIAQNTVKFLKQKGLGLILRGISRTHCLKNCMMRLDRGMNTHAVSAEEVHRCVQESV